MRLPCKCQPQTQTPNPLVFFIFPPDSEYARGRGTIGGKLKSPPMAKTIPPIEIFSIMRIIFYLHLLYNRKMANSSFGAWRDLLRSVWRGFGAVLLCSAASSAAAVSDFSPLSPDTAWQNAAPHSPSAGWQVPMTPDSNMDAPLNITASSNIIAPITAPLIIIAQAQAIRLRIDASGYTLGATFTVSANIFRILGVGRLRYQWLRGQVANNAAVFTSISNATNSLYTLNNWDTQYQWLRVSVTYLDLDESTTDFLSEPLLINRPLQGDVITQQRISGSGLQLSANISNLRDENNPPGPLDTVQYAWQNSSGNTVGRNAIYNLSATDAERGGISLQITHQDAVGFLGATVVTFVRQQVIRKQPVTDLLAAIDSAALEEATDAIGARFNKQKNVVDSSQFYLNDTAVHDSEDLATALASSLGSLDNDADNIAADFAFGSMAAESSLGWIGYGVNGWVRAARTKTSSTNNNNTAYSGSSFSIYSGIDKAFGKWLAGAGFGYQRGDIDAALGNDGQRDDKIQREIVSAFPYVEWHGEGGKARLLLGYGVGDIDIIRRGDEECRGTATNNWYFGNLGGEMSMFSTQHWGLNLHGNIRHSRNEMESGVCDRQNTNSLTLFAFSAIKADNSEASGGMRLNFGHKNIQVFALANLRKPFGDYRDDVAYDGGGGFHTEQGPFHLRLEYRKQLNDNTQHKRESVNGSVEWLYDNWSSHWTAGLDNQTLEMHNRWQLQHQTQRGVAAFNSGVYWEHRQQSRHHTAGVELRITL